MNKTLVTIVALSVDSRSAILYMADGSTMTIPQGDARLPGIVIAAKEPLANNQPVEVDVTPIVAQRTEFTDAEAGTGGVIKFFRTTKAFLRNLINTDSPEKVDVTLAFVSPLEIGVFPGQDEPQPAMVDGLDVDASEDGISPLAQTAKPVELTNDQKLDNARTRVNMLVGNSKSTASAEFHLPMDESKETIVAVHQETGAIIPDAQKLSRQLKAASRLQDYAGFTKFVERLSAIIDQRGHSVEDLMKFIEKGDLPIADDGSIVIYKRLNNNGHNTFTDVHSGKIQQKVGSYVFMKPGLVDPNRRQDCSNGLHVASLTYLSGFSGDATVVAKVRPEDVFAVPEYNHNKMRVCGYHILAVLQDKLRVLVNNGGSISSDPDGAVLLNNILRGNHVGITQHVEVGGHQGTNVTYTDVKCEQTAKQVSAAVAVKNTTLDMSESIEPEVPTADGVKATDLMQKNERTFDNKGYVKSAKAPKTGTKEEDKPLSLAQRAALLHLDLQTAPTAKAAMTAAEKLLAFKKEARKGWVALGLPDSISDELSQALDGSVQPVATKSAKKSDKSAPSTQDEGTPMEKATRLLKAGKLTSVEIAQETGLSKDQIYRIKKKL